MPTSGPSARRASPGRGGTCPVRRWPRRGLAMYSVKPPMPYSRCVNPPEDDQQRRARLRAAAEALRTACERAPGQPLLFLQLGRIMLRMEDDEQALQCFERVATLTREDLTQPTNPARKPELFLEAAKHLAVLYRRRGRRLEALNYLYDAVFLSDEPQIRRQFADCVSDIPFAEAQPALKPLLVRALAETWGEPAALIRFSAMQLLLEPEFAEAARRLGACTAAMPPDDPAIATVAGDALLRAVLFAGIVTHPLLEKMLTSVRRTLLYACVAPDAGASGDPKLAGFAAALAVQCFATDHAYATAPDEAGKVALLEEVVSRAMADALPPAPLTLAVLACYRPLMRLECAAALESRQWPEALEPVIRTQLRAPRREDNLRASIARLTPIADEVSTRVREQYEESPFPRWVATPLGTQQLSLAQWLSALFPHLPPPALPYRSPAAAIGILVAGCGTGREAVMAATCLAGSEVLAVDLSLASLAHGVRKSEELGLGNITYAQADILQLEDVGRQFDIVECVGVLHHLRDPLAGWRTLSRLVKPGGYMLLGLYSEYGRRDLDPAKAYAAEHGYSSEADDLRRFRSDVLALAEDHPVRQVALRRDDFYNLSMLRDMLFHVQEHRFTIPRLARALAELGLHFGGFVVSPQTHLRYVERFGQTADPASLENWETLESENPDTFSDMYQFLALKPARQAPAG